MIEKIVFNIGIVAFGLGSLALIVISIALVLKRRCPECKKYKRKFLRRKIKNIKHDHEYYKSEGETRQRPISFVLYDYFYSCKACGHEWIEEKSKKEKGHIHVYE
jgi:rubredoxin